MPGRHLSPGKQSYRGMRSGRDPLTHSAAAARPLRTPEQWARPRRGCALARSVLPLCLRNTKALLEAVHVPRGQVAWANSEGGPH